jgi:hypothetical protein
MNRSTRQRGRPRIVSEGAEASRKLGLSHGHICCWWLRNGRNGPSPAKMIKQRCAKQRLLPYAGSYK